MNDIHLRVLILNLTHFCLDTWVHFSSQIAFVASKLYDRIEKLGWWV